MSASVFFDAAADVYRVRDEDGQVMGDGQGNQLAFDTRDAAEDMLERRADLFSIRPTKLGEHR